MISRKITIVVVMTIIGMSILGCRKGKTVNGESEYRQEETVDSVADVDSVFQYSVEVPDSIIIVYFLPEKTNLTFHLYPDSSYVSYRTYVSVEPDIEKDTIRILDRRVMEWASILFFAKTEPVEISRKKADEIGSEWPKFHVNVYNMGKKTNYDMLVGPWGVKGWEDYSQTSWDDYVREYSQPFISLRDLAFKIEEEEDDNYSTKGRESWELRRATAAIQLRSKQFHQFIESFSDSALRRSISDIPKVGPFEFVEPYKDYDYME